MRPLILFALFPYFLAAQEIRLVQVVSGVSNPVDIQSARDGSGRLFIVEQAGRIRIMRGATLAPAPFLDIVRRVTSGGERGLLGLAFPPDFSQKQHFYVNYTNIAGDTVISRFRVTSDADVANPDSEQILLTIDQPYSNHNGGQIQFGPDGFLYIGMGDGGSANDPQNYAQNRRALLGKMLRLDVESNPGEVRVPPSNPFAGDSSYDPRIWALGLRNPWRFSFDRETGDLWIADVGQNRLEEVNFQPASSGGGENYGWVLMEGTQCVRAGCNQAGLVMPVAEYGRSEGGSISGGYVYRGRRYPSIRGIYFYADYISGRLWGISRSGQNFNNRLFLNTGINISSFGESEDGELFVADHGRGIIHRIEGPDSVRPALTSSSVVNAASYEIGLTPGSAASLFGTNLATSSGTLVASGFPLPASLAGVSVQINGRDVPLYAVASTVSFDQVNFQVPWDVPAGRASLTVTRAGSASDAVVVPVMAAQPAVFTSDGNSALVVHADNTLVSSSAPLSPGETVYLYATGLGPVRQAQEAGLPAPTNSLISTEQNPVVTIGGIEANVAFAGLAPGLAGVYQVNFTAPAGLGSGTVALRIRVGDSDSAVVRVPVR